MTEWISSDDIWNAIRAYGGGASVAEIAAHIGRSKTGVRNNVMQAVRRGHLVELGVSSTGARCYGIAGEVEAAPPAKENDTDRGDAAPTSHTEPPPRPTESNLARHAWDELDRAGLFTDDGDFYDGMTGRAVMDLVDVFVEQGHSGMSASIVIDILRRVMAFEPLSPLTDDPAEWEEVMDGLWQSRRHARAFSQDGGKTYRLNGDGPTQHTARKIA